MGRYDNLVEQIKTLDTEEVKDWDKNTDPDMKVIEEQKVYIWIRLYLKEECDVRFLLSIIEIFSLNALSR
jgi:hypothetical protein